MQRRTVLLGCLAALILFSGCVDPEATASFDSVNATEVAERQSIDSGELHPDIRAAITQNTTTDATTERPPFRAVEEGLSIEHEGAYYRIEQEAVGSVSVVDVGLDAQRVQQDATVSIDELPRADRQAVRSAIEAAERDSHLRAGVEYTADERNRSTLLDEGTLRVSVDGQTYEISVVERDSRERTQYVYTARQIAPNETVYGQQLIDKYAFTMERPPEGAEPVVQDAVNGTYYGEETDGFIALRERFMEENSLREDEYRGVWLVRYEGQLYWVELSW